jgi:hypothetical protein
MIDWQVRAIEQAANIDDLRDENRRLRELLIGAQAVPNCFGLSRSQALIFRMLMTHKTVTMDALYTALYSTRPGDGPTEQCLHVMVYHTRRKVERFGIGIKRHSGQFWEIPEASKARVRALVDAPQGTILLPRLQPEQMKAAEVLKGRIAQAQETLVLIDRMRCRHLNRVVHYSEAFRSLARQIKRQINDYEAVVVISPGSKDAA